MQNKYVYRKNICAFMEAKPVNAFIVSAIISDLRQPFAY